MSALLERGVRAWILLVAACGSSPVSTTDAGMDPDGMGAAASLLLFGGRDEDGELLGDTWVWNGATWRELSPAASPPARYGHALARDATRGTVVLFGGTSGDGQLYGDTWEWDGQTWTELAPAAAPPAREGHALVYDASRAVVVLFGGGDQPPSTLRDTWEWDGQTWTERTPTASPASRRGHALAQDAVPGQVVLFGGLDVEEGLLYGDTWVWDGQTWTERAPSTSPSASRGHALVHDADQGQAVLYGGWAGTELSATWVWDGQDWQQRAVGFPISRQLHALAYDADRGRVVLFGGRVCDSYLGGACRNDQRRWDDTWEWDGDDWADVSPDQSPPGREQHALIGIGAAELP